MNLPTTVVQTETQGHHVIVRVTGELDVFNAASVTAEMEAAIPTEAHGAVIDLSAVGFLDSTAIRKLFGLAARLGERRQRLVVATPAGSTVARTLQLVEFSRAAPVHPTVDDALSALGAGDSDGQES
jgi:anti-anti-sigma factor